MTASQDLVPTRLVFEKRFPIAETLTESEFIDQLDALSFAITLAGETIVLVAGRE